MRSFLVFGSALCGELIVLSSPPMTSLKFEATGYMSKQGQRGRVSREAPCGN